LVICRRRSRFEIGMAEMSQVFFDGWVLPFLQGILRKAGGCVWFFDGEFVVEAW
jgi:hypothetical protein